MTPYAAVVTVVLIVVTVALVVSVVALIREHRRLMHERTDNFTYVRPLESRKGIHHR